jgi:hypothetical protein
MKRIKDYIIATIQTHLDYLERERERTSAKTWEEEQKRRRASLENEVAQCTENTILD